MNRKQKRREKESGSYPDGRVLGWVVSGVYRKDEDLVCYIGKRHDHSHPCGWLTVDRVDEAWHFSTPEEALLAGRQVCDNYWGEFLLVGFERWGVEKKGKKVGTTGKKRVAGV